MLFFFTTTTVAYVIAATIDFNTSVFDNKALFVEGLNIVYAFINSKQPAVDASFINPLTIDKGSISTSYKAVLEASYLLLST